MGTEYYIVKPEKERNLLSGESTLVALIKYEYGI